MTKHTILVVEDNPDSRQLACWILEDAGFIVVSAESGEEALEKITCHTISLILMDISLPKMDGKATTQTIRTMERFKHLPILALTAHAMQEEKNSIMACGVTNVLTKPIDEDTLLNCVKNLLM